MTKQVGDITIKMRLLRDDIKRLHKSLNTRLVFASGEKHTYLL